MANTAQVNTTFKIERRFGFCNTAITIAFCIAMACLFATTDTFAKDYSFTWSANPEPVQGYKLYYKKGGVQGAPFDGTGATQGPSPITIGKQTTFTISGLDENTTYYFALTAVNGTEESGFSDIVAVNVTSTDITSTTLVPPTAAVSVSAAYGEAPFSVNFDGGGSTSAQPPIVSYSWDFGDGSHADGQNASVDHTFTAKGEYTTILTVTDSAGLTNQTRIPVFISEPTTMVAIPTDENTEIADTENQIPLASIPATDDENAMTATSQTISVPEINFELQEVQADYNWKTVTFAQPFVNPVVVAGPPSYADARPVTLRIRNVTSTDCQVRVDEYEYLSDKHTTESFNIIVMEKGVYSLDNGLRLEAGTFTSSTSFQQIALQQTYNQAPVVLTQVLTENEASAVSGRIRNTKGDNEGWFFEHAIQEQERNKISHKDEIVGYIAWEPGSGEYAGLLYEVGVTAQSVTDSPVYIEFESTFPSVPFFIAGMQTATEEDTSAIRRLDISTTTANIQIEEETSKDKETSHAAEKVGYITIGPSQNTMQ